MTRQAKYKVDQIPEPGPVSPIAAMEPETPTSVELVRPFLMAERPWERQTRETDAQWALFLTFRDMAYPDGPEGRFFPRSGAALAAATGLSEGYLRGLSASFHWYARAGSYDRELERAKTQADISEVQRSRVRHLRMLAKLRSALEGEADKLLQRVTDPDSPALTAKELVDCTEKVVKLERLLMGEHTEHVRVENEWNLEALEYDELKNLDEIRRKARGLPPAEPTDGETQED